MKNSGRLFISWTPNHTRNESLCYYLGADCYYARSYFKPSNISVRYLMSPIRYLIQGLETFVVLLKKRPKILFVQNPPIFTTLVAWFYCLFTKAFYITDTHTCAFDRARWRYLLWLYKFLGKRALINILHNKPLTDKVRSWGLPAICIGDFPFRLETEKQFNYKEGFNVVVVSIFDDDEPIDEILKAANRLPDINFYITGSLKAAPKGIQHQKPYNVTLTDFLPHQDYVALLKDCDLVVVLTTQDFTMQNGALEALELERPIVTSHWQVLRDTFNKGTIHIDNTSTSLVQAIKDMKNQYSHYAEEIKILRNEVHQKWEQKLYELEELLSSDS